MSEIIFRNIKEEDLIELKRLLKEMWKVSVFTREKHHNLFIDAVWETIKARSDYMEAAEIEGKFAGIVCAVIKGCSEEHKKEHEQKAKEIRDNILADADAKEAIAFRDSLKAENLMSSLEKRIPQPNSSELVLFVVNNELRGHGVGKTLIRHWEDACRKANIIAQHLITDTHSDYHYYDHNGFQMIQKDDMIIHGMEKDIPYSVFLYNKTLTK